MIITEIKKIGKGVRFKVYIDDKLEGIFNSEILAKYKLKTGQQIEKDMLEKIKIANSDLTCFDTALSSLEGGMKTEKMLKDVLRRKGYYQSSIESALEKVKEYGYLNDEAFAEAYISTYSTTKGKQKLRSELLAKGVDREIVEDKLSKLEDEEQTCQMIAEKYMKNRVNDVKTRQKLIRHLLSKGFEYSIISKILGGCDDWN